MAAAAYWAVIGDIVHSRSIKDRARFQKGLESVLDEANRRFAAELLARWTVTTGDEFQALYAGPAELPDVVEFILDALQPVRVRFGIGRGGLSTELKPTAVGMDGPAFHAARLAINYAKRKGMVVVAAGPHGIDSMVTDIWNLAARVACDRTRMQRRVIALYRQLRNQYAVAEALGLTQATISVHLSRGLFFETEAVLAHVRAILSSESHVRAMLSSESDPPGAGDHRP